MLEEAKKETAAADGLKTFLDALGLAEHYETFRSRDLDIDSLLPIIAAELREAGVSDDDIESLLKTAQAQITAE